ncbi:diacylglycerol/lipid kinase family protein [Sandaracinus amylolyticus]|uniref:diacylglycerol/lipid kinase family protein n=1 Tax=Sandaracinus amylolyticus TaxID=927083 RepID=UPI001F4601FF|nr:YegS/Rv2252/BmrU family lipid kinase [Sandaracinus amylolyticus]UJR84427.1 Hypothetical protein I5071_65060 [Sandaracinus amylolyticus]
MTPDASISPVRPEPEKERERATMIVNPSSGKGLGATMHALLVERLRARWPSLDAEICTLEHDAEAIAREAALRDVRTFVVLGGDGTLNNVINGVASVPGALARSVFGVLPAGTGNDLAGTLGLGTSLEEAADRLARSEARIIDLGLLDDRLFANVSAGGLFAEASEATSQEAKSLAGRLAYLVAGSRALLDHAGVGVELTAKTPEGMLTWRGTIAMFAVCNAQTFGGGKPLAPFAQCDDGWLDAFVVQDANTLGLARVLLEISGGTHLEDDRVVGFRASEIDLRFDRPTHVNVDGEVAVIERARYRVLPGATRVLVAPEADADAAPSSDAKVTGAGEPE